MRLLSSSLLLGACALALVAPAVGQVRTDFDGDGYSDLAVGVPGESVNGKGGAGAVHVLYGSPSGISAAGDKLWHRDVNGVLGAAVAGDGFGFSVATGDFDGDGYTDLAIGAPEEDVTGHIRTGSVHVLYGGPDGISAAGDQIWHQDSPGVKGAVQDFDRFGATLVTGDFDDDGYFDLAIGVPHEDISGFSRAGAVNVLYGSAQGLTAAGDQLWHQDQPGVRGQVAGGDEFGASLAAGDFDGDGFWDLAIGAPVDDVGAVPSAGAVNVLYGSASGLTAAGDQRWTQDSSGVWGVAEQGDQFGGMDTVLGEPRQGLVAADFDGNGCDDLAIGVPGEDFSGMTNAGVVQVLYGSPGAGLTEAGDQTWHQDAPGIAGVAEGYNYFGSSLAAGDFDGNGRADLVAGGSWDTTSGQPHAGQLNVIYASFSSGLTASNDDLWHQDAAGVYGLAEQGDFFGWSVAAGDFDGDGISDMAVGVMGETVSGGVPAGAVHVFYGGLFGGLSANDDKLWHQDRSGIQGAAEDWDNFGYSVASG